MHGRGRGRKVTFFTIICVRHAKGRLRGDAGFKRRNETLR